MQPPAKVEGLLVDATVEQVRISVGVYLEPGSSERVKNFNGLGQAALPVEGVQAGEERVGLSG